MGCWEPSSTTGLWFRVYVEGLEGSWHRVHEFMEGAGASSNFNSPTPLRDGKGDEGGGGSLGTGLRALASALRPKPKNPET